MFFPILLQTTSLIPTADTSTIYITFALLGGFILMIVIGSMVGNKTGQSSHSKKPSSRGDKKRFRKLAKQVGISPMQIKLLENLAEKYKVPSPLNFITMPKIYTATMKKAIREYNSGAYSTEIKENYKLMLFSAKQKMDRVIKTEKRIRTSNQFSIGKNITIKTATGNRYSSRIVSNLKSALCVEVPEEKGIAVKLGKWEQVLVSLWEKEDKGYTFISKITGFSTIKNKTCLKLQHSNSIKFTKQRNFPRKILERACYFYKINIALIQGVGKNIEKKAVLSDTAGKLGTVIEISAGGCSIRASKALNKGELLKIDFDIERKKRMSALGKVVNINKIGISNIMHIQFTKMSKANMNSINSYIYGIDEKDSVLDY